MQEFGGVKQALHLLRAILRECTYLPDPAARKYMHRYTIKEYRKYCPKAKDGAKPPPPPIDKQVILFRRCQKQLSLLHRANEGYLKPLEKVLMQTYGRRGKRRFQLLQSYFGQDERALGQLKKAFGQDVKDDSESTDRPQSTTAGSTRVYKYSQEWKPSDLFRTLFESQMREKSRFDRSVRGRQNMTSQAAAIPATNSWGLPMPKCRVKNITRDWYRKVADNLLPPLLEPEWKRLRSLAIDPPSPKDLPKRRTRTAGWNKDEQEEGLSNRFLCSGPQKSATFAANAQGRPHHLSRRILRSMYLKIITHTPLLEWNTELQKFNVIWARDVAKKRVDPIATVTSEQSDILFGTMESKV